MRVVGWVFFLVFVAPGILMAIGHFAVKPRPVSEPVPVAAVAPEVAYADRVEAQLGMLRSMEPDDYTSSMDMIGLALAAFRAAAQVVDEGSGQLPGNSEELKREELRRELSRRQAAALPVLRDAMGPVLRDKLWVENGSARTIGAGFRTIEFVSGAFAANRNIQAVQQEMQGLLVEMRFTRANYRWFEGAQELSYYAMEPPGDGEVVIWLDGGRWRPVE